MIALLRAWPLGVLVFAAGCQSTEPAAPTRDSGTLNNTLSEPPAIISSTLSLGGAKMAVAGAAAKARENGVGASIAVVDGGGHLLAFERLEPTFAAGPAISIGKARTAALFKKPTSVFEKLVNEGRTTMVALDDFTPLQGGVPIVIDDRIVGAIGVSGASSAQQDEEFATAGANEVAALGQQVARDAHAPGSDLFYLQAPEVQAAFDKGVPLLERPPYKIHASRREEPGLVEIHERETDIIYVLTGSATIVTGGAIVAGKGAAPHEIRGESIDGGQTRRLSPGDVMVIPNGTPHWFREVDPPLTYYVVKVVNPAQE